MATNVLLVIVIILVCILYLSYYSKYSKEYSITQIFLNKFTPDLLYERNPIVIYDSLAKPQDLLKTIFKYQYLFSNEHTIPPNKVFSIKSKFALLFSSNETPISVKLINPAQSSSFKWYKNKQLRMSDTDISTTSVKYVDVQLKKHQVMIMPSHWIMQSQSSINKIDLDDIASYVYFGIF